MGRGLATSISCFAAVLLSGCPNDPPAPCEGPPGQWTVLFDDLDGAVLCAFGEREDDIFFAGGGMGNGANALAIHYDGNVFTRIGTDTTETFWWGWANSSTDVFFVGSGGVIYHYTGSGPATAMTSPTTATLYGVWGTAPDDVWAVGGMPVGVAGDKDVILHYDGSTWEPMPLTDGPGVALFKVWGSGRDDVYIVGQRGTILHWDGSGWTPQDGGVTGMLFTVSGNGPDDVWIVGGPMTTVLHNTGSGWQSEPPSGEVFFSNGLNGVSVNATGDMMVVGFTGVKWRRMDGCWIADSEQEPWDDLHGAWLGPSGHGFGVGGGFVVAPATHGTIGYWGIEPPVPMLVE